MSPEAARFLIGLKLDELDLSRMSELSQKNNAGTLTPQEQAELADYAQADLVIGLLQAKAKLALKRSGNNGQ